MRNILFCVMAVVGACKKSETNQSPPATPAEASKPTEPAKAEPAKAAPAVAAAPAVTLATGEAKLGCFAWSESAKSAACITGERGSAETTIALSFVGSADPAHALGETIDDAMAKTANAALAKGFAPLGAAKAVAVDTAADLGNGATLTWTSKVTAKGGDNTAPTAEGKVVVKCSGGKEVGVYSFGGEGQSLEVAVHALPTHALVEVTTKLAREGEYATTVWAARIDPANCEYDPS